MSARRRANFSAAAIFAFVIGAAATAAAQETVLYRFTGGSDGGEPLAGLTIDGNGNLYGATVYGGSFNLGTVFELTPPATGETAWHETVLHSFAGGSDGMSPQAGLIIGADGALYGTTSETLFRLTPPAAGETAWNETVLHQFCHGSDGCAPMGDLLMEANGNLYGTTTEGGRANLGTVFQAMPPVMGEGAWSETVLYWFRGRSDGNEPMAGLVADQSGNLYGTTYSGYRDGTVFRLTPPAAGKIAWRDTVLHRFLGGRDGATPLGELLMDANGNLYGTTAAGGVGCDGIPGCGTVYRLTPPAAGETAWTETVLYRFGGGSDGEEPEAGLVADETGNLYSTTFYGGRGDGTVFRLASPAKGETAWHETVLHRFRGHKDGRRPTAGLIIGTGGNLYGTTYGGGGGCIGGCGTVFEVVR